MISIKNIKLPQTLEKKIEVLEKYCISIYLSVYFWDFKPNSFEDRVYYTKELAKAQQGLIIKDNGKTVGYLLYSIKKLEGLEFLYINEVDILKEYRKKGYSKLLYSKLLKKHSPNIIYGEVRNPISAKSMCSAIKGFGYYIYWAEEQLDSSFPITEKVKLFSKKVVEIFDYENLPSYTNGIKEFTIFEDIPDREENVIPEFKHIFEKIKKISDTKYKSAFGVLICVKKDLIDKKN